MYDFRHHRILILQNLFQGPKQILAAIKPSFASVMQSQKLAVSKFVDNLWNADTVVAYRGYQGSNTEQAKSVIQYAARQAELPGQICPIDEDQPWKPLPNIPVMELEDFVDAPAHLLFLGIVKSVYRLIVARLASNDGLSPFCHQVDGQLDEIKSLHLSWCMSLPFKRGGLGGWVSCG
jgi:hypothetical protein